MPAKPMKAMAIKPADINVIPSPRSPLGESAYSDFYLMAASRITAIMKPPPAPIP